MFSLSERKQERLYKQVMENELIDRRTYNMYLGGVIAYGLLINIILCHRFADLMLTINPLLFYVGYFISVIAGTIISSKSNSPLISFLGYNLVVVPVGMVVSTSIYYYGGISSYIVLQAIVYTAGITCVMICLSILFPDFFSQLGGLLVGGLLGLVIVEIVFLFLGVTQSITAFVGAAIFSLYIGYDYWKAQQYPMTVDNAVDSALDIYLDVINLFLRILRIIALRSSSSSSSSKKSF